MGKHNQLDQEICRPERKSAGTTAGTPADKLLDWDSTFGMTNQPTRLEELRLGLDAVRFKFFTKIAVTVNLHYETDESLKGYHHCVGEGCPCCLVETAKQEFHIFPVYSFGDQKVAALRVPVGEGPGRLMSLLLPVLKLEDPSGKVITATRNGSKYTVNPNDLPPGADSGAEQISAFLDAFQSGQITLNGIIPRHSREILAAVPRVARLLAIQQPNGGLFGGEE